MLLTVYLTKSFTMKITEFKAVVKHDNGQVRFKVFASSEEEAKKLIMLAEGCPERAIKSLKGKTLNSN